MAVEPPPYEPVDTRSATAERPAMRGRRIEVEPWTLRIAAGVLLILVGVLILVAPHLLAWLVGFGLVAGGIFVLVSTAPYVPHRRAAPRDEPERRVEPVRSGPF